MNYIRSVYEFYIIDFLDQLIFQTFFKFKLYIEKAHSSESENFDFFFVKMVIGLEEHGNCLLCHSFDWLIVSHHTLIYEFLICFNEFQSVDCIDFFYSLVLDLRGFPHWSSASIHI